jgi:putative DNA-invertase from lambdoid prophage Rac
MQEIEGGGRTDCWYAYPVSSPARVARREQFDKPLDDMQHSDALVVARLDCLGRNAGEVLANIQVLATLGVRVFLFQFAPLELASRAGKSIPLTLAAGAEMESVRLAAKETKGDRNPGRPLKTTWEQRAAMAAARRRGESLRAIGMRFAVSPSTVSAATAELMLKEA